jgi:hypothetical protein
VRKSIYALAALLLLGLVAVATASALGGSGNLSQTGLSARYAQVLKRIKGNHTATATTSKSKRGKRGRRGRRGKRGPRGAKGATGPAGSPGVPGTFGNVQQVVGPATNLCDYEVSCAVGGASVDCPPGTKVVGGGYQGGGIETIIPYNRPTANGWSVIAVNWYGNESLSAVALCAS